MDRGTYYSVYKCRHCGEAFIGGTVQVANDCIEIKIGEMQKTTVHYCGKRYTPEPCEQIGVADLVGMTQRKTQIDKYAARKKT